MRKNRVRALVLLVVTAALAACGGGGSSATCASQSGSDRMAAATKTLTLHAGRGITELDAFLAPSPAGKRQDFSFSSFPQSTGINNAGVTGASLGIGVIDAGGASGGVNRLLIFTGMGDGTFSTPQLITLPYVPVGLVSGDFNADGLADIAVLEGDTSHHQVDFFTGNPSFTTVSDSLNTSSMVPGGEFPVSISIGRIDGNGVDGVAVGFGGGTTGSVLPIRVAHAGTDITAFPGTAFPTQGVFAPPDPRAIFIGLSNQNHVSTTAGANLDIFAATSKGIELFDNNGNPSNPSFNSVSSGGFPLDAANAPVGVLVSDINGDGLPDLIALNKGAGTASIFVANSGGGYASPKSAVVGANPIALTTLDFNGDGKADLAVVNAPSSATANDGGVTILTGNGSGVFTLYGTLSVQGKAFVTAGKFVKGSAFDDLIVTETSVPGGRTVTPGRVRYLSAKAATCN